GDRRPRVARLACGNPARAPRRRAAARDRRRRSRLRRLAGYLGLPPADRRPDPRPPRRREGRRPRARRAAARNRRMTAIADFRAKYASTFRAYLDEPGEAALGVAYALGREAVAAGLGLVDLAAVHNGILVAALREAPAGDAQRIAAAAG